MAVTGIHHLQLTAPGGGAYIWLNEVAPNKIAVIDVYFEIDPTGFAPKSPVEIVEPLAATHWGTKLMTVRDPDARIVRLQAT